MLTLLSALLKPNTWLEKKQNTILSAAAVITTFQAVSSISGLLRQRLLISYFYDTPASRAAYDAFLVAFQLPDMLFQLIVLGALSAAFIPIFTTHKKIDEQKAFKMSSIMMNVLLLFFVIASVAIGIWAEPLTLLRTGASYQSDQILIVVQLTRIMIVAQFFFAISNFLTGILQSYQRFIIPSIAPIFYNVGIVAGVMLFHTQFGIYSAGLGVVIGAFLHMIIQLPLVLKLGFRYYPSFNIRFDGIKEFFILMPSRFFALSMSELRKIALGFFATSISGPNFTIIQLGLTLMTLPIRFFGVPISQASLPFLSEEAADSDRERFKDLMIQSLHQISFFTYPMAVLLLILRIPIVRLTFGTHNFPWASTLDTGRVVAILALTITVQAMVQLLTRAFYALKDTNTPLYIAVLDTILFIIITAFFTLKLNMGIMGMAAATSITAVIEFLLSLFILDLKVKGFARSAFWIPQIKMICASFLMAVFLYLPFRVLDVLVFETSRTIELIALTITTSTIGMLVYLLFAALFEIKELSLFVKVVRTFEGNLKPFFRMSEAVMETSVEGDET